MKTQLTKAILLGEPRSLDMMGGYHEQVPQLGRHLEDTRGAQLPDKAHP